MLYYDKMDGSEGIVINKTSAPKECDICHHWYFLDKGFDLQIYICNGYHDVLMMTLILTTLLFWTFAGLIIVVLLTELAKEML